jgi:dUTP pyrophosphatase
MIQVEYRGYKQNISYQTELSAGADLYSEISTIIEPGTSVILPTGVFIKSFSEVVVDAMRLTPYLSIASRSGLAAKHNVFVLNGNGTVDCDYPKEIGVILFNAGKEPFVVNEGDRVAQMIGSYSFKVDGVDIKTVHRTSGFGSTGK